MKRFFTILVCGMMSLAGFAQTNGTTGKWYLQGLVGANNTGTEGLSLGEFGGNIGLSGAVEFGYQFNPYIELGIQGGYNKLHSKVVEKFGFDNLSAGLNLNFNLSNIICGVKEDRKNIFSLYAGVIGAYSTGFDIGLGSTLKDNENVLGYRVGLQYERPLKNDLSFLVNAGLNSLNDRLEKHKGDGMDSHVNLMVGLRKYFGGAKKRGDYKNYIEEIVEVRKDVVIEKEEIIEKPKDVYAIFFEIDKIIIRDSEVDKIKGVVDFLNAHPEKVVFVFGYADKNTGTAQRNAWLAENRARVIVEELTNKYGIDPARIISYHQGDRVQPYAQEEFEKNRATICVITDFER